MFPIDRSAFNRLDQKSVATAIGITVAATLFLYKSHRITRNYKKQNAKGSQRHQAHEIPTPGSCFPVIGHMASLGSLPGKTITEWHKQLGPIIKIYMGSQTWVFIDSPTLAHRVFVTHGAETSFRPYSTYASEHYSFNGKGIGFAQPGSEWNKSRAAVLSILAPKQIDIYMNSIQQEAVGLASRLINASAKEGSVDPFIHFQLQAINVIFTVCFGRKFSSTDDSEFLELLDLIETTMGLGNFENDVASFLPMLSFIDYFAGSQMKMKRFIKERRDPVFKDLIARAMLTDGPNLVKSLDDKYSFPEQDQIVLMCDIIAGGTDTTSITLSWMFAILANYPEVQERVSAEIDQFVKVNGHVPSFNDRKQLPYCISVIKECMRYKPSSSFGLPHSVQQDVIIDNYVIPKGAMIMASMDSMHSSPDIYPQADTFCPERFMENQKTMHASANGKLEDRDLFMFGWGRRICPGIYLAEAQLFNVLINVLARCSLEIDENSGIPNIEDMTIGGINTMTLPYKLTFANRPSPINIE